MHARNNEEYIGCEACSAINSPAHSCADGTCLDEHSNSKNEIMELVIAVIAGLFGLIIIKFSRSGRLALNYMYLGMGLELLGYLVSARPVLKGALKNLFKGRLMDELFLMSIASIGAFIIGATEEAIGVMVLYRIGELLQDKAADKSRRSIRAVLALRPDSARVKRNGDWVIVKAEEVVVGDELLVRPGEKVPVDGKLLSGLGSFDTSSMTGESEPRAVGPGDRAMAGFIVMDGAISMVAEKAAGESSAARIIELVEHARSSKAKTELFITRFARWYTPMVVGLAALAAFLPPLLIPGQSLALWTYRALVMLVISCPCALVISVPLGYFGGLGGAARRGILVKGASVLDTLADASTVVFDKTGTLTDGSFAVQGLSPSNGHSNESLLIHAGAAGSHSNHPLAKAIRAAMEKGGLTKPFVDEGSYKEIPGHGSEVVFNGARVMAGSDRMLHLKGIEHPCEPAKGTEIHVASDSVYVGRIELGDSLKADGKSAIKRLKALGINKVLMLTGDSEGAAKRIAEEAELDEVHSGLLPQGKLERLEGIMAEQKSGTVLFVGDGINDAPVLARADAGIAMGLAGAEAAMESADVVLMKDEPGAVADAIESARHTRRIVKQNIAFALGIKVALLAFGAFGLAAMWQALIADVGVALLAVLNSGRALMLPGKGIEAQALD